MTQAFLPAGLEAQFIALELVSEPQEAALCGPDKR